MLIYNLAWKIHTLPPPSPPLLVYLSTIILLWVTNYNNLNPVKGSTLKKLVYKERC